MFKNKSISHVCGGCEILNKEVILKGKGCSLRTFEADNRSWIVDHSYFDMMTVIQPKKINIEEKRKGCICEDGKQTVCDARRFLLDFLIGFSFNSIFNGFCFITS